MGRHRSFLVVELFVCLNERQVSFVLRLRWMSPVDVCCPKIRCSELTELSIIPARDSELLSICDHMTCGPLLPDLKLLLSHNKGLQIF